ncbi:wax ester/triacylglycerol synthase domain-containing protein [Rhodococcus sp. SGAir0479]|uniref:wax ester/triacylglycerol synthase domain-containing protein n=1 Tax=Rhodococcus sp. SGAir0479 TaxID=2567884 RepID=UPI0020C814D9|nr:wax ester/triacylglycerol synthase domain-containing protein [Rhodococcus sp. SGAir0479]
MRADPGFESRCARLEPRDAEFVYNEHDGHLEHLVAVYLFDETSASSTSLTEERVREWMHARLGSHRVFTSVITRSPLGIDHPHWVPTETVDLRHHLRVWAAPGPGWDGVGPLLGEMVTSRVDLARPPWELHVITGVTGLDLHDGPVTAVALKLHHSAADGLAVMELAHKLFSETPLPAPAAAPVRLPRTRMLVRSVRDIPRRTRTLVRSVPGNRASARAVEAACAAGDWPRLPRRPATRFNTVASGRACLRSIVLPGKQVAATRSAAPGITINDVVLAAVGGALDRYLREHGERPDGALVAMVPRSMRRLERWQSANQLVVLAVDMHTDVADPVDRLTAVSASSRLEKKRTSHPAMRRQVAAMDTAPPLIWRLAAYLRRRNRYESNTSRTSHTMISNIPLTVDGLTFGGARAVAVLGSQPPIDGDRLRHFVTTASGGDLVLTVIADPEVMPDLPHYLEVIRTSLGELHDAVRARGSEPFADPDAAATPA